MDVVDRSSLANPVCFASLNMYTTASIKVAHSSSLSIQCAAFRGETSVEVCEEGRDG